MPITPRKAAHIRKMQTKWFQGRAQIIVLTIRTPTGGTDTLQISGIWRVVADFDPTLEGPTNALTHLGAEADILCEIDTKQITLQQLKSVLWAQLSVDKGGVRPATKYTLTDIELAGMLPGGDRYITRWTRQH